MNQPENPELPTIAIIVYAGWTGLMLNSATLPWWILAICGSFLLALHGSLHHEFPAMPWYQIQAYYFANKEDILKCNDEFWYSGYSSIAGQFLLKTKDSPLYPEKKL